MGHRQATISWPNRRGQCWWGHEGGDAVVPAPERRGMDVQPWTPSWSLIRSRRSSTTLLTLPDDIYAWFIDSPSSFVHVDDSSLSTCNSYDGFFCCVVCRKVCFFIRSCPFFSFGVKPLFLLIKNKNIFYQIQF